VRYGTIVVDLERGRPLDLLPDRAAATVADWLRRHPGIDVVARDRSPEYARGIADGAPRATQVVDRWHLLRNLREVAERVVARHPSCLAEEEPSAHPAIPPLSQGTPGSRERRLARYEAVRALRATGLSLQAIQRRLGLAPATVRKYADIDGFPERAQRPPPPSMLDPHASYLAERWAAGCRNARQLWRELRERGYPGSPKAVTRWAQRRRTTPAPTTPIAYVRAARARGTGPPPRSASPRRVACLMVARPDALADDERGLLACVCARHADLAAAAHLVGQLAAIVRDRTPEAFDPWLATAEASVVADLRTFARGLRQDEPAIRAALTLPWSTGPVEGHITRLKLLKRQMYGRAKLDLLRARLLAA
jgi:transposase